MRCPGPSKLKQFAGKPGAYGTIANQRDEQRRQIEYLQQQVDSLNAALAAAYQEIFELRFLHGAKKDRGH